MRQNLLKLFLEDESGVTVIEIVLILVVLIGLVIIFKNQLNSLIQSLLDKITKQSSSI
ncbi:Flp1 family type IVb pilin [Blautia stercoris]|uniref:Flp1 family type IVb pilin n=1 Tax=Blautia stercoris TaxID=871664 RepID=UPI00355C4C24